jgi:hypothetical protein
MKSKSKFNVTYPDGAGTKVVPERLPHVQQAIASSVDQPQQKEIKVVQLPCYGIRIEVDGKKVTVTSVLPATNPHPFTDGLDEMNGEHNEYQAAVETIETMIASHYKAGVKVTSKKYVAGIEETVYMLRYKS